MGRQYLPHFIGIGAPRCGTRWLSQCFMEHPEIGISEEEVYFFSTRRLVHSRWSNGESWYSKLLYHSVTPQTKVLGEITPFYLYDEDSAELIYKTVPNVKLICCVRDQFERAYSWYTLFLRHNSSLIDTKFSFNQFLTYCADVYGREGFYLEHINRFLKFFPRESIHFLVYDDLVADPKGYIQKVFEFLEVDSSFQPPAVQRQINSITKIRASRSRLVEKIADKLLWHRFYGLGNWIQKYNNIYYQSDSLRPRHLPSDDLREKMHSMFEEHNIQLGEFLGRDLTHWNTGKQVTG